MRSFDFVNHSCDYRPNWTPLSPITIINFWQHLVSSSSVSYFLDADKLVGLDTEAQNLVNCLQVLEILTPVLHAELLSKVVTVTAYIFIFTRPCSLNDCFVKRCAGVSDIQGL